MASEAKKNATFMRLPLSASQQQNYERAASLKRQNIEQWACTNLDECAFRDIANSHSTVLSDAAFERFLEITNEPIPAKIQELLGRKAIWVQETA